MEIKEAFENGFLDEMFSNVCGEIESVEPKSKSRLLSKVSEMVEINGGMGSPRG